MRRFAPLAALAAMLPACSPLGLVDALTPRDGYRLDADLPYGPLPRQRLDLYRPDRPKPGAPTVVFFYGGAWEFGDKGDYRFVAQALAARGYTVAVPDYRLYPEVRYPAFLEDGASAVDWLRRGGAGLGVSGAPLALMGHSAGAYIAVMLTVDRRWLNAVGGDPCATVAATVGLSGPYDFLPLTERNLMEIFGPEDGRPQTQPVTHVDGRSPPLLLLTGDADTRVRPRNSASLAGRVRERGGRAETVVYPGLGHVQTVAAFARPLRWLAPVLDDVDRFLGSPRPGSCTAS
ncbi:alpha/beta hydrolase [Azospirillum sp.]|uniref:alpha/beta hydrolase n=1 Tax=Azospirillum sp. TaxID=34012 RepID=UPI003D708375